MHFKKMAKSPYLASQDLWKEGKGDISSKYIDINFTIKDVIMKQSSGLAKDDIFMFLIFEQKAKDMILNSTNSKILRKICKSAETNDWIGKNITIFVLKDVEAFGSIHDALRIRPKLYVKVKVNVDKEILALRDCLDCDQLQKVFLSLPNKNDQRVVKVKDEMKLKLK